MSSKTVASLSFWQFVCTLNYYSIIMAALCNRGAIIFLPCNFYLSVFFFIPRLISAAAGLMSTIL